MPGINHAALTAGVVAVSMAVAAAIAIYESPELRRYADDVRRRIAIALHALGDGVDPPEREPLFNRPEDAEGFLQSRRGAGAEPGVDADDETRRRQREELMYWNALLEEKRARERGEAEVATAATARQSSSPSSATRGSSFDDFLRQDESAETGAYVFNTGTEVVSREGLVRRNVDGSRGVMWGVGTPTYVLDPFADEHRISSDDVVAPAASPDRQELMSDIYSATTQDPCDRQEPVEVVPQLVDLGSDTSHTESGVLDRELGPDEYVTAGQEDRQSAYSSIQAWAQNSNPDFYSPLPMSPPAPHSEPEIISGGGLTPDSASVAGSGEDVANDAASSAGAGRFYDVLSESDGMPTPASWSEVGSVVSEHEAPIHA